MPAERNESLAAAVTEVSEKLSVLLREEIELAKAEVTTKVSSLARGGAAVAAGAVFGVFAVVFLLLTIAWVLDAIFISGAGDIWVGFAIVLVVLGVATAFSFLFAWRKLKVGPPTPKMAIDEAKKIRETVKPGAGG
ncbi:MAG TPA: phage holin family protein [Solirubrobacteraceae bacterium]|nr:phage holin family protein [Solirubrobacteraceae bacterium]